MIKIDYVGFEPTTSASIRQHDVLLVKSLFKFYSLRFDVLKVVLCLMVNSVVARTDISGRGEIFDTSSDHNNHDTINQDCT